jgi:ferredoxin-NADP reductase
VKSFRIALPMWMPHLPGQHYDVRLTAPDGYQAQRSYSIASGPEDDALQLTVEEIADGEVSPYLVQELRAGDELELRGPVGGYFTWRVQDGGPLLLIAGGSGVVPLRAMLRHRAAVHSDVPARLLYSSRTLGDVIYRDELNGYGDVDVQLTLTREWPDDWQGHRGRVDGDLLRRVAWPDETARTYICGPTGFVEAAANGLVELGHDPAEIRTERFGATGRYTRTTNSCWWTSLPTVTASR